MKLKLIRDLFGTKSTSGKLFVNGVFECYTLEDTDRKLEEGGIKIPGVTCIQRGIFTVIIDHSNRFNRDLPHVLNVPQFDGIRIHSGNTDADTEGCILVGRSRVNDDYISESRVAFDFFFQKLKTAIDAGESVELEII